jgi:hypothetical protein
MNLELVSKLYEQSHKKVPHTPTSGFDASWEDLVFAPEAFAELIVRECADIVEQAKKSPFVSLDDAKRMSHFVDVTKKKINKHFGIKE